MDIIKTILNQKNRILYNEKIDIFSLNEETIKTVNKINDKMQQNMIFANIYYLRAIYDLEYDNAVKACEYFEKIPHNYFTIEMIKCYVVCLNLCYQYKKVVNLLLELLHGLQCFEVQHYCLSNLVNDKFVADGVITKEAYLEYKKQLIELLEKEKNRINSIIP